MPPIQSRLAINSVTLQNYTYPLQISSFVGELFAGFSLLNLKNDSLRRRAYSLSPLPRVLCPLSDLRHADVVAVVVGAHDGTGFDSLKYDLKKIEEVVYDISLRGLTVAPAASS